MRPSRFAMPALCLSVAALLAALPSVTWAQTKTFDVEAGPIWSQSDAEQKCPNVAKANGATWTGQWHTTVPGRMSVCELRFPTRDKYITENVEAGPIWSNSSAQQKCPEVAKANGGTWTGQWHTTVPGRMSVCELRLPRPKG